MIRYTERDGTQVAIYRSDDGNLRARPAADLSGGIFEEVSNNAAPEDSDDILRVMRSIVSDNFDPLLQDLAQRAADEIERLRAEIDTLKTFVF